MAINLQKGQKISLDKEAGVTLTRIIMGLAWDAVKAKGFLGFGGKAREVDLDASCIVFDEQGKATDVVWFQQLKSRDGSIVHTGDNRTGAGDDDDEQIIVDLTRVPANVKSLVFTVNSFTGQNFSQIQNATCRIVNASDNKEVARFNLSALGSHNAQIMAKLYRHGGEWFDPDRGPLGQSGSFAESIPQMSPHL